MDFGLALVLLMFVMMRSCLATNRKALSVEMNVEENKDVNVGYTYPGSSVNNHHYIPRQDFNNNGGDGSGNGGSG
ncbi:hypothetical protein MANES_04G017800v8 [Manihot esculenta]|uniref:Uncharacterized protein n=1 Tax=Manihot esculenta TaxID=3983 RepID=A0A2C9W034_MANES|nr:hypothetical protein MANES_04G017800v8 [Manihot esculenta]